VIVTIPPAFSQTIEEGYGAGGRAWLERLPALLAEYEHRWSLTVQPPFELSYNYVAPAVHADGTEVVVKAGVPNPELLSEMAALRFYDGRGICRLLEADEAQGVMLLERLRPGTPLATVANDDEATLIAAGMMEQLWRPLPADHPFRPLASWTAGIEKLRQEFEGGTGPFPAELVEAAERLRADLLASPGETVLLHGDCHHWNILRAERQPWLVIDPKGVAGEAIYETSSFLYNRLPEPLGSAHAGRVLARRTDILAERLGFDRKRLIAWGIVQSVLSSWWTYEDHGRMGEDTLACARHLLNWL
jgi:streptomycin 6-kinase